jgi:hypothetical protein
MGSASALLASVEHDLSGGDRPRIQSALERGVMLFDREVTRGCSLIAPFSPADRLTANRYHPRPSLG